MCRDYSSDVVTATAWWKQPVPEEYTALNDEGIPLHVDWWGQNFRNIRSPLSCGGHDGFTLRLELVNKIVHLFPFSPQFQSLTGSTWSEQKQTPCPISLISPLFVQPQQNLPIQTWVVPDWSRCDLGLLWLDDGVCDDGPWGHTGHASAAKPAKSWHLLPGALSVPPGLLQFLGLPPHLCLGLALLSL